MSVIQLSEETSNIDCRTSRAKSTALTPNTSFVLNGFWVKATYAAIVLPSFIWIFDEVLLKTIVLYPITLIIFTGLVQMCEIKLKAIITENLAVFIV